MKKIFFASLVAGLILTGLEGAASANLITNGSFENNDVTSGGWSVFSTIDGWTTTSGSGIEIQDHAAGAPFDGNQLVELDSYSNSTMQQVVSGLTTNQNYILSFAYSPRPGVQIDSNWIEVYWNGSLLAAITGISSSATTWNVYSYTVTSIAGNNTLGFSATGISDSLGGYLDAVSLDSVPVPEPATMLLFGTGLIGLASTFRRKKA